MRSVMNDFFQKGDIVRLNEQCFSKISSELFFPQNLFYIEYVDSEKQRITLKNVNGYFSYDDIQPVKVNGEEDRDIYYDPIIAASYVEEGEEIPAYHSDFSIYYMDSLKESTNTDGHFYYDLINKSGVKYVHEIQHKFLDLNSDLKIHYYPKKTADKSNALGALGDIANVLTAKKYNEVASLDKLIKDFPIISINKNIDGANIIATFDDDGNSDYVLVCPNENMAIYYRFYINSAISKFLLLGKNESESLKGKINISRLKKLPVYYSKDYASCCITLQVFVDYVYLYDKKVSNIGNDTLKAINSFLLNLRDSMVLELAMPKLFEKAGVHILQAWKAEIQKVSQKHTNIKVERYEGLEILTDIFDDLMETGNELMENMNRLRLYMNDFMESANKLMNEGK